MFWKCDLMTVRSDLTHHKTSVLMSDMSLLQSTSVPIGSNPFSDTKPVPEGDAPGAYVSPLDDPPGEPILQSRLHGTEDQRREKERFEEQQRNEAKKKAIAEKKAQKEVTFDP